MATDRLGNTMFRGLGAYIHGSNIRTPHDDTLHDTTTQHNTSHKQTKANETQYQGQIIDGIASITTICHKVALGHDLRLNGYVMNLCAVSPDSDMLFIACEYRILCIPLDRHSGYPLSHELFFHLALPSINMVITNIKSGYYNNQPILATTDFAGYLSVWKIHDIRVQHSSAAAVHHHNKRERWNDCSAWSIAISPRHYHNNHAATQQHTPISDTSHSSYIVCGTNSQRPFFWTLYENGAAAANQSNKDHSNNIPCVSASPCGRYIASASIDSHIRIMDVESKQTIIGNSKKVHDEWGWACVWIHKSSVTTMECTIEQYKEYQSKHSTHSHSRKRRASSTDSTSSSESAASNIPSFLQHIWRMLGRTDHPPAVLNQLLNGARQVDGNTIAFNNGNARGRGRAPFLRGDTRTNRGRNRDVRDNNQTGTGIEAETPVVEESTMEDLPTLHEAALDLIERLRRDDREDGRNTFDDSDVDGDADVNDDMNEEEMLLNNGNEDDENETMIASDEIMSESELERHIEVENANQHRSPPPSLRNAGRIQPTTSGNNDTSNTSLPSNTAATLLAGTGTRQRRRSSINSDTSNDGVTASPRPPSVPASATTPIDSTRSSSGSSTYASSAISPAILSQSVFQDLGKYLLLYTTKRSLLLLDSGLNVLSHIDIGADDSHRSVGVAERGIDRLHHLYVIEELSVVMVASGASDRLTLYQIMKFADNKYELIRIAGLPHHGTHKSIVGMTVTPVHHNEYHDASGDDLYDLPYNEWMESWRVYILWSDATLSIYLLTHDLMKHTMKLSEEELLSDIHQYHTMFLNL